MRRRHCCLLVVLQLEEKNSIHISLLVKKRAQNYDSQTKGYVQKLKGQNTLCNSWERIHGIIDSNFNLLTEQQVAARI